MIPRTPRAVSRRHNSSQIVREEAAHERGRHFPGKPTTRSNFGRTFVHSDAFRALFRDGMALVEETAAYLDGDGREDSRTLPRQAALTYASESMRLTHPADADRPHGCSCSGRGRARGRRISTARGGASKAEDSRVRLQPAGKSASSLFDAEGRCPSG